MTRLLGRRGLTFATTLAVVSLPVVAQDRQAGSVDIAAGTVGHFDRIYDVDFGSFHVPMNRRDPDNKQTFQLRFVRYKSTAPEPGHPAVYLAGGPGGSVISFMNVDRARGFLALLDERDFIAFDQRGVGQSEPHNLRFDIGRELPLDEPTDLDDYCELAQDIARQTLAMLKARDIDPWALTTEQSADDLDDLRKAVGAEKLVLWGSSYGTHLALAAARQHPDSFAALILAGTEGPDHTFKLPSNIQTNLQRLGGLSALDPAYAELMPDLVATIEGVLADLDRNPESVTIIPGLTATVSKWDLQKALSSPMGSRSSMQQIPSIIYAMSHGERFKLATTVMGLRRVGGSSAMSLCMDCASWATEPRLQQIQRDASETVLGAAIDFPFPCMCEVEGMPRLGDDFRARVESDIPVLFVSGTLDGRTPISNAKEIAEGFSDHRHLIIRNASHGGDLFTSSPKILESVKMFLRGETLPWTEIDGPEWQFDPPRQRSLEHEMLQVLTSEGFDAAVARYMEIRKKFAGQPVYDFRESVLNELGYRVLRGGRSDVGLAINVFRLNTVGYPESFNTWDSLAEGYMEKGDTLNATKFYEKSLELNPDNSNALQMLGRVRQTGD